MIMNTLVLLAVCLVILFCGYVFYGLVGGLDGGAGRPGGVAKGLIGVHHRRSHSALDVVGAGVGMPCPRGGGLEASEHVARLYRGSERQCRLP